MYILHGNEKQIINSEFVERFCLVEKDDAVLVVASYGVDATPCTIAKYKDLPEARQALMELYCALGRGQACFAMPESSLFCREQISRDARTKRKGGS